MSCKTDIESLPPASLISFTLHSQAPDLETSPSYEVKNAINNLDTITAVNKSTINAESNLTQYFDTMDSLDQKTPSNYGYRIQIQSISGPNARENIYEQAIRIHQPIPRRILPMP